MGPLSLRNVSTTMHGNEKFQVLIDVISVRVPIADGHRVLENKISIDWHLDDTIATFFRPQALLWFTLSAEYFTTLFCVLFSELSDNWRLVDRSRLSEMHGMANEKENVFGYSFILHTYMKDVIYSGSLHSDSILILKQAPEQNLLNRCDGKLWTNCIGHGKGTGAKAIDEVAAWYRHAILTLCLIVPTGNKQGRCRMNWSSIEHCSLACKGTSTFRGDIDAIRDHCSV